jgi:hypothetical protein
VSLALHALVVFVVVAIADVCWARYTAACARGSRWYAAGWSVSLYWLGSISVMSYTADHRLILPALAGAFVGTAIGVKS